MAVVLSDGNYRVQKRGESTRDADGALVPAALDVLGAELPGASTRQQDGSWTLRLDPAVWPIRAGDRVVGPGGVAWIVDGVPRAHENAEVPDVDYVGAVGSLDPVARP